MDDEQKQTILIVDDTPENIEVLFAALGERYRVRFATSGEKALRVAASDPVPDLILLDVMMPLMDGYEVCRRLKADQATRDIPVIFVSALREVKDESQGLALGAVDYITKPFSQPIVLARVKTHLDLRRAALEQRQTELQLQRALNETELILEHASLGVLIVVREQEGRRIARANRAAEQILGYGHGELTGRDTRDIAPDIAQYREFGLVYEQVLAAAKPYRCDQRLRRRDERIILTHMVGVAIDPHDFSKGTIWLIEDITERHAARVELEATNADLSSALETLKRAQGELLRTEKLAALGSLVAGIAHELNTPVGNAMMVASTLHEQTETFARIVGAGGLKRSQLETYVNDARTASDIIVRNLRRAAEQVSSFKQVAVDQTSSQRRRFQLREIVTEIVLTLRPTFRKTPYTVEHAIDEAIVMDSFPGPLGQVVANLVNNAIMHGFEGRPHGKVTIGASMADARTVELTIADDGVGIEPENIERIFDPFFTTKLGRGGSGLGLHIVHTLVEEVLGGKVLVDSRRGQGTRVCLRLPVSAPQQRELP